MKKGFTIVEVSILFVIFLIVAFLVAPLSLDETLQAKNVSRWRQMQSEFNNIFASVNLQMEQGFDFKQAFESVIQNEIKSDTELYKITFMNGTMPNSTYRFDNYKLTHTNSVLAYKLFDKPHNGNLYGMLMYDVNGQLGPNVWGKDVFGYNIYSNRFEPFCKNDSPIVQKQECSKHGTGLSCSNVALVGGQF